eukprot:5687703-Pleurochrysis_carterae.AAC.3
MPIVARTSSRICTQWHMGRMQFAATMTRDYYATTVHLRFYEFGMHSKYDSFVRVHHHHAPICFHHHRPMSFCGQIHCTTQQLSMQRDCAT